MKKIPGAWFSLYSTRQGWGGVVAGSGGLLEVVLPFGNRSRDEVAAELARFSPGIREGEGVASDAAARLSVYFAGEKVDFALPIDWGRFTRFQSAVYAAVATIPYGSVKSYAAIADAIGRPTAARGVGAAMAANPLPIIIPCHRVLGCSGRLTGYSGSGGIDSKAWLLRLEGVTLDDKGRVDELARRRRH